VGAKTSNAIKRLGDWQLTDIGQAGGAGAALVKNTVYQAASDGFALSYVESESKYIQILSDTFSPPTQIRGCGGGTTISYSQGGFPVPVAKGMYWKVISDETTPFIAWMPLIP
jgi:hypothetical protein